jgi:hypothetical protein
VEEDHEQDFDWSHDYGQQPPSAEFYHTPMTGHEEFERLALPSNSNSMSKATHMPIPNSNPMPPLTRQTTYSSLPPSPRYEDYDFSTKVNVKEFEEALGRLGKGALRRSSVSASAIPRPLGESKDEDSGKVKEKKRSEVEGGDQDQGLSMWDLLRDEVGVEDWDGWIVDGKWERIANFLAVPLAVEKVCRFITSA